MQQNNQNNQKDTNSSGAVQGDLDVNLVVGNVGIDDKDNNDIDGNNKNDELEDFGDDGNDDDVEWNDDEDDDGVGDWGELEMQDEYQIEMKKEEKENKSRDSESHTDFWECGRCQFKNNVWRSICMACHMPKTEIIAELLNQNGKKKTERFVYTKPGYFNKSGAIEVFSHLPQCRRCNAYIIEDLREWHSTLCSPVGSELAWNDKWYVPLSKVQTQAINKILQESIMKSNKARENLEITVEGLGFTAEDLEKTLHFMEWKVPLTIRINKDTIVKYLINDPFYRNLFETGTGGGGNDTKSRQKWEARMFGDFYNQGVAFERPKYGCLNISLKDEGCVEAAGYGDCYFVLKDMTCRWRTTLTDQDSMSDSSVIGILSHCCHVLSKFHTTDLTRLITTANGASSYQPKPKQNKVKDYIEQDNYYKTNVNGGKSIYGTSDYCSFSSSFREIQIHGPVRVDYDIAQLWIPPKYEQDKQLQQFAKKNNIELRLILQ